MAGLINTDHLDQSIDILEFGDKVTFDRLDQSIRKFDVSNPHPLYGKDPNILNEYGHSIYPKMITSMKTGLRVQVNNAAEEAEHMRLPSVPQVAGVNANDLKPPTNNNPWG